MDSLLAPAYSTDDDEKRLFGKDDPIVGIDDVNDMKARLKEVEGDDGDGDELQWSAGEIRQVRR